MCHKLIYDNTKMYNSNALIAGHAYALINVDHPNMVYVGMELTVRYEEGRCTRSTGTYEFNVYWEYGALYVGTLFTRGGRRQFDVNRMNGVNLVLIDVNDDRIGTCLVID